MSSESLIFEMAKRAIELQKEETDSLDRKASTLTAFAGVIFTVLIGVSASLFAADTARLILMGSIAFFLASILPCLFVNWVRKYRADPNPETLAEHYLNSPEQDTLLQITSNVIDSWRANSQELRRKAIALRLAFVLQTLGFLSLGSALIVAIISKGAA